MDFLADTGFLIDLWREAGKPGAAVRFARDHAACQVGICWVVVGEFLSGAMAANQDAVLIETFLSRYPVIQSTPHIVGEYARLFAGLRARNGLIGPNDLWIAACAVALDLPLLTANETKFSRVTGLKIVAYRKAKALDSE